MKYTKGSIGRIFLAKFSNDDVLLDGLDKLARKEKIKAATETGLNLLKIF